MSENEEIEVQTATFLALVKRVSTCADGGFSVTLSIPQTEAEDIKKMFDFQNQLVSVGVVLKND